MRYSFQVCSLIRCAELCTCPLIFCHDWLQASNVDFLCTYKFDFNKLFYDGIPYVDSALNISTKTIEKGFSSVFNMLVELKKPLLGHNMFYDLLLMYEKFYEPLPVQYVDFKQQLHSLFPLIVDTKNVCLGLKKVEWMFSPILHYF